MDKTAVRYLFPLLIIYVAVTVFSAGTDLRGDEHRYTEIAQSMAKGSYNNFWNGPGYPLILLPFAFFNIPWIFAKLMNPLFLFLAVIFFFKTCMLYGKKEQAIIAAYLFGGYFPFLRYSGWMLTECLTILLVCAFIYFFCGFYREKNKWYPSAIFLCCLALTKVIFGYLILLFILVSLSLMMLKGKKEWRGSSMIFATALLLCAPYLLYTFHMTGKPFYWSTAGGMSLYWMSSPSDDEYGDWHSFDDVTNNPRLQRVHGDLFSSISGLSIVEKDAEFKKQALRNIKNHPAKFVKNWIANICRMIFQSPYSYTDQKLRPFFYAVPNIFIVVLVVISAYPLVIKRSEIPFEIAFLLCMAAFYFGGSSLLSSYSRHFWPVIPFLFLWLYFCCTKIVKFEFRNEETENIP